MLAISNTLWSISSAVTTNRPRFFFGRFPRLGKAQDYDCFRVSSSRSQDSTRRRSRENVTHFPSLFHETLSNAGKILLYLFFMCHRKTRHVSSSLEPFRVERYSSAKTISPCFAKRFRKVLDYANLIRSTRAREERGWARKKILAPS